MQIVKYHWRDDDGATIQVTRTKCDASSSYRMLIRTTSGFELESAVSSKVAAEALRRMRNRHSKAVFHLP
jgi:hypothetical protein